MADVPAPENKLVGLINLVLDHLIEGVGAELTITSAKLYAPILRIPIFSWILRKLVEYLAGFLDVWMAKNIDIIVIRFQNDARKVEYDSAIEQIKKPDATSEDIELAKDALERLIHRSK